jgi:preprotein translocase subunit SecE
MTKVNPAQFLREVRQEAAKVTWPTRKETLISTGMVMFMVGVAAVFFFLIDQIIAFGVKIFLGFGS